MSTKPVYTEFPSYAGHRLARCFKCNSELDGKPVESGYPPGHGAWRQTCPTCKCITSYDLVARFRVVVDSQHGGVLYDGVSESYARDLLRRAMANPANYGYPSKGWVMVHLRDGKGWREMHCAVRSDR